MAATVVDEPVSDEKNSKMKTTNSKPLAGVGLDELGYSVRPTAPSRGKPGDVGFDDLGNALYQWKDQRMLEEGEQADTRRQHALSVANLVLVDDEPPPDLKIISTNKKGLRIGYNPYDSGRLSKEQWKKPRDLRALSQWIEAQKRAADNLTDPESESD